MTKTHQGKVVDSVEGCQIIDCTNCGFRHVMPIPSIEELREAYRHDFYEKDKPLSIPHKVEDQQWLDIQYSDRYDTFEESINRANRRILDIGSGAGFFLKHGAGRGWDCTGIEPSKQAAEFARSMGLTIIEDILCERVAESIGTFDVVHASLVVEHVPDPHQILSIIQSVTKPGGMICLTAPNDYNPFQSVLREVEGFQPWWLSPKHHLNYFTPDSLSQLIEAHGFTTCLKESSFPIDLFLLLGDNYIGDNELGRICHKKRIKFEAALEKSSNKRLKRQLYRSLAELNLGREICIYARKNDT